MIQDIYPHLYHNEYHPHSPNQKDYILGYDGRNILLKKDMTFFVYEEVSFLDEFIYLFEIDDISFYLADLSKVDHISLDIRTTRSFENKEFGFAGVTGWQLYNWMNSNQYCGRCGYKTIRDTKERAMRCPNCGNIVYPTLSPAVIVGIINDKNEILISQYAHGIYKHDALIAGYAEIGETIEETVHREVKEETGLNVKDLVYYKSQPWSYSGTLLFGFYCKVDGSDEIKLDETELQSAIWINQNYKCDLIDDASLTAEMIHKYQNNEI